MTLSQKQQDYQHIQVMRNTINSLYSAQTITGLPLKQLVSYAREGRRTINGRNPQTTRPQFVDNGIPVSATVPASLPDLTLWDKTITELGLNN